MTHSNRRAYRTVPTAARASAASVPLATGATLDDGDARIISALAEDGRRSNRDVSRTVGLSERVIGQRIRRLREHDVMRVVAVVDMHAAGFEAVVNIGVRVSGRAVDDVARELARLPQVLSVLLMSGGSDIEIVVVARNQAALATFV